jgi:hypothetical protein
VYRASISRTVGRVVAPFKAASTRGLTARGLRVAAPRSDANLSVLAPGSMIPPVERRGDGPPSMQPIHSRALGRTTRAVRQARASVVAGAGAMPVEYIRKME